MWLIVFELSCSCYKKIPKNTEVFYLDLDPDSSLWNIKPQVDTTLCENITPGQMFSFPVM